MIMNNEKRKEALVILIKFASVMLSLFIVFGLVFGLTPVKDNNMYPRVSEGDLIFFLRITDSYDAGDVVISKVGDSVFVNRIIAECGDVVDLTEDGQILVNGAVVSKDSFYCVANDKNASFQYPLMIGEDQYFLLSDFCSETGSDSRSFGTVSKSQLKGKTITVMRRRGF